MFRWAISRRGLLGAAVGTLFRTHAGGVVAQCEEIELYPGYPDYRGNIPGLIGPGDSACLEELEEANPKFDRVAVDRANEAAARRLGLAGPPELWTWENWMAIEGELGLQPMTCYACTAVELLEAGPPIGRVRRDDPRLLLGVFADLSSTDALRRLFAKHGLIGGSLSRFLEYDIDLRALSGAAYPGHWNAEERLAQYDAVVSGIASGGWFSIKPLLTTLVTQGGYAPTPSTAHPYDQVMMIYAAIPVLSQLLTPLAQKAFVRQFEGILSTWENQLLRDPASAPPFAEWFGDELRRSGMLP